MENNQGTIRNPTAEELEALRKKKLNTNIYKETAPTPQHQQPSSETFSGSVKMKPKSSPFEPDPEPYRLITTNNVIKENLTENQEIFVRRMSGVEDAILGGFGDSPSNEKILEGITQIIMNCTKSDIDMRKLPLNEKMPLFIFILSLSLGKIFDAAPIKDCSTCDSTTTVPISIIDDFPVRYMMVNDTSYPAQIKLTTYEDSNLIATIEMPKIGAESTFFKTGNTLKEYIDKMSQIVRDVSGTFKGKQIVSQNIPDILTYLNTEDKEKITGIINEWTENYGADYKIKITTCTNPNCCMNNQEVVFDPYEIIKKYVTRVITKQKKEA